MQITVPLTLDVDALVTGLMTNPDVAALVRDRLTDALHTNPVERHTLGEALRQHMFAHRMTRQDLASRMGISYPYLCELLHDKKTPGKTALEGLTRAGVDTSRVQF